MTLPVLQIAEEEGVDERLFDLRMDQARHGTRSEGAVVAVFREPGAAPAGRGRPAGAGEDAYTPPLGCG
jgi:hypothetical protein